MTAKISSARPVVVVGGQHLHDLDIPTNGAVRRGLRVADDGDVHVVLFTDEPASDGVVLSPDPLVHSTDALAWVQVDSGTRLVAAWVRLDGEWVDAQPMLVPGMDAVYSRNRGVLESDALADRKVAIIGLGSGGSTIVDELAKSGVRRFLLADRDRLELHNVGRHVCGLDDLGRQKTRAMRDRVRRRNPYAEIEVFEGDIVQRWRELSPLLADCDVIVTATDNNPSRLVLNRFAVETGIPMVFGRAYKRACGGDVVVVRPGGPCYNCLFGKVSPDEEVSSESSGQAPAYSDVVAVIEPGLSLDIAPIALMCARMVLVEMFRDTDTALGRLGVDLEARLFLWGNRRDAQFKHWAPMRYAMDGLRVQRWYGMRTPPPQDDCAVCNPEAFLAELEAQLSQGPG
jgi:molybdopterin-synthase adenylyltransferase